MIVMHGSCHLERASNLEFSYRRSKPEFKIQEERVIFLLEHRVRPLATWIPFCIVMLMPVWVYDQSAPSGFRGFQLAHRQ